MEAGAVQQQQQGEEVPLPPLYAQHFRLSVVRSPANSQDLRQVTAAELAPSAPGQLPAMAHLASVERAYDWMDRQRVQRESGKHPFCR
jgi:hypothetical protein